jgi:hypothetical protein
LTAAARAQRLTAPKAGEQPGVYGVARPIDAICRFIFAHFQRHRARKPWAFVCRVTPEATGLSLAVALLMWAIGAPERDLDMQAGELVFFVVVLAPPLETLLFQALPVFVARKCRARLRVQIIASWVPFALAHGLEDLATGLAAGMVGGFYLAFTYAHWRQQSRWTAFWTTWAVHTLNNVIAVMLALALGEL